VMSNHQSNEEEVVSQIEEFRLIEVLNILKSIYCLVLGGRKSKFNFFLPLQTVVLEIPESLFPLISSGIF
jgi:hypothetical protein